MTDLSVPKDMLVICSADNIVLPAKACLTCSLAHGSPPCGYDYGLLHTMFLNGDRSGIHVSDLTGCAKSSFLRKTSPVPEYVHEMLTRTLGTITHGLVEESDEYADAEITVEALGIVGRADRVYKNGRIIDYKCQPAGELVTLANGWEKPIEEIKIFECVLAWDGEEYYPGRVIAIVDGGVQEVYEVLIASGQKIRASGNHPVLTDRGWVRVSDLLPKEDRVVVLDGCPGHGAIPLADARLIGYLVGDGATSRRYGIGFTNNDPETIDDVREICISKGWDLVPAGPSTKIDYRITNKGRKQSTTGPMAFIQKHGLHGKTARGKSIPTEVMVGNREVIVNFLAAYFDCDGTVTDPESTVPPRITFSTKSPELARQTSELLRRTGIANRVHAYKCGYGVKTTGVGYHVCIWQAAAMLQFLELVPFHSEKKLARFNGWAPRLEEKQPKGGKNLRRVEAVTSLGLIPTIGIEVEKYHTYISNGVVTHNTTRWICPRKLPYSSHALQVNIYAHLLRNMGRIVTSAAIQYIDMSGPTKCRKCKLPVRMHEGFPTCPSCGNTPNDAHLGAVLVEVPLMDEGYLDELIQRRRDELQSALETGLAPMGEPSFLCNYCAYRETCTEAR